MARRSPGSLPRGVQAKLDAAARLQERLDALKVRTDRRARHERPLVREEYRKARRAALFALDRAGFTRGDAAMLLGVSRARVYQLMEDGR